LDINYIQINDIIIKDIDSEYNFKRFNSNGTIFNYNNPIFFKNENGCVEVKLKNTFIENGTYQILVKATVNVNSIEYGVINLPINNTDFILNIGNQISNVHENLINNEDIYCIYDIYGNIVKETTDGLYLIVYKNKKIKKIFLNY
jgi:hypothetical protein